jgi:hypothetical protein
MSILRWLLFFLTSSHVWAEWTQIGADIDGELAGDQSGTSVSSSADGNIIAIGGSENDGTAQDAGHVRVYQYVNGQWTQLGDDIDGEARRDRSGRSVSLSSDGTILAIGAEGNDATGSDAGHVRVYQYSPDTKWTQLGEDIDGEAADDESGISVSLSSDGTILAIGAHANDGTASNAGHVRVYQYSPNTTPKWTQLGSDIDGETMNDRSGWSVSLSSDGSRLAVGAKDNSDAGSEAGHVRVYQYTNSIWTQIGEDIDGEAAGDYSGYSVSLSADGTIVAIGAGYNDATARNAGHVRVYQYSANTTPKWTKIGQDIDGEAYDDNSGRAVSISADGTIVAIGAHGNDAAGTRAGHVRVYKYANSVWSKVGVDIDGKDENHFSGFSVSLSADGSTVVIGAIASDLSRGHVSVYNYVKPPCEENQHVSGGTCEACPAGKSNPAGDDPNGADTECSPCIENEHVLGGKCTACVEGKTRAAGDDPSGGDTACDPTLCQENHHVVNHACQPCALGTRPAGDDASGDDTQCEIGPCGGLTCVRGTCVNDVCQCPVGYGGMTCSRDMTASGQLQFLESRRKSLPSKQDIKDIQKDVKSFIKDTLKKALLTKSVKEAVKETKMAIEERDLNDRAKLAVLQLKKQPVIALSTENKDTQDDCLQTDCAHVDIKDTPGEIVFLNTQEEAGSWSVLSSGGNLLSKQTRVSENVYDMQCWNNSWTDKVQFDISEGSDFFECNDHVILIGSQAAVCTDETCQNGGTCAQDGLSFVCDCPIGFGGEFCEDEVSVGNCYDLDCSDFGGHKTELCTECTEANCCNYATRDLFNAHCDTLTSTADYVNAKCCHRTYCI